MSIEFPCEQRYVIQVDRYVDENGDNTLDPEDGVEVTIQILEPTETTELSCMAYTHTQTIDFNGYWVKDLLANRTIFKDISPAEIYDKLSHKVNTEHLDKNSPDWQKIASDSVEFHLERVQKYADQGDTYHCEAHLRKLKLLDLDGVENLSTEKRDRYLEIAYRSKRRLQLKELQKAAREGNVLLAKEYASEIVDLSEQKADALVKQAVKSEYNSLKRQAWETIREGDLKEAMEAINSVMESTLYRGKMKKSDMQDFEKFMRGAVNAAVNRAYRKFDQEAQREVRAITTKRFDGAYQDMQYALFRKNLALGDAFIRAVKSKGFEVKN